MDETVPIKYTWNIQIPPNHSSLILYFPDHLFVIESYLTVFSYKIASQCTVPRIGAIKEG